MKGVACALFLLVVLAASGFAQAPDDKLIVPGQRIGKWTLEMTIDQLLQMNGQRRATQGATVAHVWGPDMASDDVWVHRWDNHGLRVWTIGRDSQRIEALAVFVDEFKTDKGVCVKSTREEVEKAYGQPTGRAVYTPQYVTLVYDATGLAVILENDAPTRILVFRAGGGQRIWKY